jgi:tyrosine-protein kinase Etk/Wzc
MAIMPPTREYSPPLEATAESGIEFDLLDLLVVMAERKLTIILATVIGLFLAMVVVLLMHPVFTAKVVIMPPQQGQSSAALVSQLGSLASLTGLGGSASRDPNDLYLAILESNTVAEAVVKRLGLQAVYHTKTLSLARFKLTSMSKFLSEKGGMISIAVKDQDPHRAADIANAYVDELHAINERLIIGEASVRRMFFSKQLTLEKDRLTDAEIALKQTQESTGAVSPTGQTGVVIQQVAQLQAQIISREVQLDAMRTSSTDQNPDVIRLNTELEGLREQIRQLESGGTSKGRAPGDISLSSRVLPEAQLAYLRKERDVQYHVLIFDLIARQFEAARLDEAKAAPVIQILDPAQPPDRKSGPYRALWTLLGGIFGFILGCVSVVASYVYARVTAVEVHARRIDRLRRALSFGSVNH